jgi:predicted outer membrane repeat protein
MVVYVNVAATGANDGSSWANAYTSLPSALTAANSGDEIWVASGTYRPTTTTNRGVSFALKNGVGIYGGFLGTETSRSQRDPAANVTILSGDIGTPGSSSDNSYHVVTADSTVTASAVLDGSTITGGNADGLPASNQDRGGGMWVNAGAPTVSHCIFTSNSASEKGGGIRVTNGSPVIDESDELLYECSDRYADIHQHSDSDESAGSDQLLLGTTLPRHRHAQSERPLGGRLWRAAPAGLSRSRINAGFRPERRRSPSTSRSRAPRRRGILCSTRREGRRPPFPPSTTARAKPAPTTRFCFWARPETSSCPAGRPRAR